MSSGVFREDLLKGRVAVVTGGGSGINLGIAEKMASHGARLVLVGRTQEKLDAAVRSIEAAGGAAIGVAADVRNYAVLEQGLQRARESYGEIDILVCGAAGNFPAPAVGMSANGFKSVIDIDLLGTFNTCRAAFEWLRKPGASVICISATQSSDGLPGARVRREIRDRHSGKNPGHRVGAGRNQGELHHARADR